MATRSPKPSKPSSKSPAKSSKASKPKVTVRSTVKKSAPEATSIGDALEVQSVANKQQISPTQNVTETVNGSDLRMDQRNDRVALVFLGVFIAALFFVLGASFGNSQGNSLVDGAIDELVANSTADVDRGTLERAAIEGALKASGDGWANYFPTTTLESLNNLTANVLTGIGVSIREVRSGAIEIAGIQDDTPAFRNGLQVGDQLIQINGTDVQGASLTTVAALIRADLGKEVVRQVKRGGNSKVI